MKIKSKKKEMRENVEIQNWKKKKTKARKG